MLSPIKYGRLSRTRSIHTDSRHSYKIRIVFYKSAVYTFMENVHFIPKRLKREFIMKKTIIRKLGYILPVMAIVMVSPPIHADPSLHCGEPGGPYDSNYSGESCTCWGPPRHTVLNGTWSCQGEDEDDITKYKCTCTSSQMNIPKPKHLSPTPKPY